MIIAEDGLAYSLMVKEACCNRLHHH